MKTTFLNLNWLDIGKGLLILVVSTMLALIQPIFEAGSFPTWLQFQPILQTTIAAALLYLLKNVFTNPLSIAKSAFGTFDFNDILWGVLLVAGSTLISSLIDIFNSGMWPSWEALRPILMSSVMAGISYILKNTFTNSDNKLLKKETV